VVDGVEYIYNAVAFDPILNDVIDSGFVEGLNRWTGQSAQRISPGYDTNNSTVDFEILPHPTPGTQNAASVSGGEITVIPSDMRLFSNYPNPFNGETVIPFAVGNNSGDVRLTIMDVLGRIVREYRFHGLQTGDHTVTWDARGQDGAAVSSGAYFVRLQDRKNAQTRTMYLVR
jgi:hypothetical protein